MVDNAIIEERKKKFANFFIKSNVWVVIGLLIVIFIAFHIRTANLDGLRDVTTGGWTLGPDLDPFLFLRWAKYIVETGSLMERDTLRYVPLGFDTKGELILLPYMIAWFHKIMTSIGLSESIEHSAVLFPAYMFVLTIPAFFLFVRQIFLKSLGKNKAGAIALVSSLFLSIIPVLLPRTIAGIPEKESAAFFFMFSAFYFFLLAWDSEKIKKSALYVLLSSLFTAGMALVWGGYSYLFATIAPAIIFYFLIGKLDRNKISIYPAWLILSILFMSPFSTRYSLSNLLNSTLFSLVFAAMLIPLIHIVIFNTKIKDKIYLSKFSKIPPRVFSLLLFLVLASLLGVSLFGISFFVDTVKGVSTNLIQPITSRLGVTVAENRQPYFNEWASSFGPGLSDALAQIIKIVSLGMINTSVNLASFSSVPLFFLIFIFGSVYLVYNILGFLERKERRIILWAYVVFLITLIFSRYSESSILNGVNFISLSVYSLGLIFFVGVLSRVYYKSFRNNSLDRFEKVELGVILLISLFLLSIVSARGAIRLIMVLVPSASVMASYLIVMNFYKLPKKSELNTRKSKIRIFLLILFLIVILTSIFFFYKVSLYSAQSYVPSAYTQQWQKAMGWVRDSTPESAVFGHWWDYGYWVQSIGLRATILDGGNAIERWNHLMGRYVLTGTSSYEAARFLYVHNATHVLIDSTDIGKYTAFASIGSNKEYDRRSWMNTFLLDQSKSFQTKNSSLYFYGGGFTLDEDIIYDEGSNKIFLPGIEDGDLNKQGNVAGIGAIIVERSNDGNVLQPSVVAVYQSKQYSIPIRYYYYNGTFKDFGKGIDAGVYLFPRIVQDSSGARIMDDGAAIYLSARTVHSQLVRMYLFNQEDEIFKLKHSEDDFVVSNLKSQGINVGEVVYFNGVRGPIKIWEIKYPENIDFDESFLKKEFTGSEAR